MESAPRISCIIPFWNEGEHLFEVLTEISKVRNLIEIVCVDDASQEDYSVRIKSLYPQIKLIRLDKNLGKSGAIRAGLTHARGEAVLLLDADLRNLDHREIEEANAAFQRDDRIDMLILRRIQAIRFVKLYRADVLFTGERILKKSDLETILKGRVNGWQLESVINMWMWRNHKKVLWMPHSGINTHKFMKWGVLTALRYDAKTFWDMIFAAGINNFIKQILFFAKDELEVEQPAGATDQATTR